MNIYSQYSTAPHSNIRFVILEENKNAVLLKRFLDENSKVKDTSPYIVAHNPKFHENNSLEWDNAAYLSDLRCALTEYELTIPKQYQTNTQLTADSDNIYIKNYRETWYVVDTNNYDGKELFLLENEKYGDELPYLVVDKDKNVLCNEAWNGFSDYEEMCECQEM